MKTIRRASLILCACAALPLAARAQEPLSGPFDTALVETIGTPVAVAAPAVSLSGGGQPAGPAETPRHTGIRALFRDFIDDVKHLPAEENFLIGAIGGGAALTVHRVDTDVTPYLVDASWAHNVFKFGAVLGDTPTLLGASLGTYFVGRSKGYRKVSHVGMDMLQSLMLNEMIVETLKYTTRRERPDLSGRNSFPSGHASATFAVATALERHADWKLWVPAYLGASYVAMSRLHDDRHYLSDVVFGAAVGIVSGRTVTRHGAAIPFTVAPVPGGAALVYVHTEK